MTELSAYDQFRITEIEIEQQNVKDRMERFNKKTKSRCLEVAGHFEPKTVEELLVTARKLYTFYNENK